MTRRTFDLILAVNVGFAAVLGGLKIWSRHRLISGPDSGLIHGTATVVKAMV